MLAARSPEVATVEAMHESVGPPRTLTQMLREWDDSDVRALLRARPDLAFPEPADFSQIASRATTRQSVAEALDELTTAELWVATAVCAEPAAFTADELVARLAAAHPRHEATARASLDRLLALSLVWGDAAGMRPVRAMASLLADTPIPIDDLDPPHLDLPRQRPDLVDRAAAGSAFEFVRRMDVLVEHLDHHPVRLTRAGGFASRDIRALAQLLDTSSGLAQAHLELARAAGLTGLAARELTEVLLPTSRFDAWQALSLAQQWTHLAAAWLERHPASGPARLKRLVLGVYGEPADGRVVTAADLHRWLAWHRPRRPSTTDRQVTTLVEQAAALGVTGLGALASFAAPPSTRSLAALLPPRVDHVLIQADMTAIAPGPLTAEAAHDLGTLADVESRGGATVYRFSPSSLTRARSLGWSSGEILQILQTRSRTPVPQPLEYLVRELDRRGRPTLPGTPPAGVTTLTAHLPPERAAALSPDEERTAEQRLDDALLDAILAELRGAESPERAAPGEGGDAPTTAEHFWAAPQETLREAAETEESVWLGYVDDQGATRERVVHVVGVDDGEVTLRDADGATTSLPLRRISAAHIIRRRS